MKLITRLKKTVFFLITAMICFSPVQAEDENILSYYAINNSIDGQLLADKTNIIRFYPTFALHQDIKKVKIYGNYGNKYFIQESIKMEDGLFWRTKLPNFELGEAIQKIEAEVWIPIEKILPEQYYAYLLMRTESDSILAEYGFNPNIPVSNNFQILRDLTIEIQEFIDLIISDNMKSEFKEIKIASDIDDEDRIKSLIKFYSTKNNFIDAFEQKIENKFDSPDKKMKVLADLAFVVDQKKYFNKYSKLRKVKHKILKNFFYCYKDSITDSLNRTYQDFSTMAKDIEIDLKLKMNDTVSNVIKNNLANSINAYLIEQKNELISIDSLYGNIIGTYTRTATETINIDQNLNDIENEILKNYNNNNYALVYQYQDIYNNIINEADMKGWEYSDEKVKNINELIEKCDQSYKTEIGDIGVSALLTEVVNDMTELYISVLIYEKDLYYKKYVKDFTINDVLDMLYDKNSYSINERNKQSDDDSYSRFILNPPSLTTSDIYYDFSKKMIKVKYRNYNTNLRKMPALDSAERAGIFRVRYVPFPVTATNGKNDVRLVPFEGEDGEMVFEFGVNFGDRIVASDLLVPKELDIRRLGVGFAITNKLFADDAHIFALIGTYEVNSFVSISGGMNFANNARQPYFSMGINQKVFQELAGFMVGYFK